MQPEWQNLATRPNVERSVQGIYQQFMQSYEIVKLQESRSLIKWYGGVRRTKYQKNQSETISKIYEEYEQTHMLPLDVTQLMEIKKAERAKWVKTIM